MTHFTEDWLKEYEAKRGKDALQVAIEKAGFKVKMPVKKAKYRNQKVTVDAITFDSQKEATRYKELKLMEAAGKIGQLKLQHPFELAPAVVIDGRRKPAIKYLADFTYWRGYDFVIEDVKSPATRKLPVYRIKKHLMAVQGLFITEI